MFLADRPALRDVILFPTLRPETGGSVDDGAADAEDVE
jgi:hypothetical protein